MGFNFDVMREEDGKLKSDPHTKDKPLHAQTCDASDICMCEFGIDTQRFSLDREFYSSLWDLPHEVRSYHEESYLRPKDFEAARTLARKLATENDSGAGRMLEIVDTLEKNPNLWLGGE